MYWGCVQTARHALGEGSRKDCLYFFIDCLLEEDSLKKYSERDKMSIFLLTFFIKKTNQDLDVRNKANECLIKFFTSNPASL